MLTGPPLVRIGSLAAADAFVLSTLRPRWAEITKGLTSPRAWVATTGADRAVGHVAVAAVWLAACWLVVGLLLLVVAEWRGAPGRRCQELASLLLPTALRRLILGAAGASLALSVLTVPANAEASGRQSASTTSITGWPIAPPAAHAAPSDAPAIGATSGFATAAKVIVEPGDSLWSIAADRVASSPDPARIAAEWPRWYERNRDTIGPDPSLLHPGMTLVDPQEER